MQKLNHISFINLFYRLTLPDKLKEISNLNRRGSDFYYPSLNSICEVNIVVCTLVTSAR